VAAVECNLLKDQVASVVRVIFFSATLALPTNSDETNSDGEPGKGAPSI
jgi:hypothetical protein